jgi:hypothetical protein
MAEIQITTFRGLRFTKPKEYTTLAKVLEDIKSDKWKEKIDKVQKDLKYKDYLPCFTPTGVFSHRSIKGHEEYNGVICLDIDHIEDPMELKEIASKLDYVHAAYITPSYQGLKVIILTNATKENYTLVENWIAQKWEKDTGTSRDNRCKDIARIQYISWDPDLYYNPDSVVLEAPEFPEKIETENP